MDKAHKLGSGAYRMHRRQHELNPGQERGVLILANISSTSAENDEVLVTFIGSDKIAALLDSQATTSVCGEPSSESVLTDFKNPEVLLVVVQIVSKPVRSYVFDLPDENDVIHKSAVLFE